MSPEELRLRLIDEVRNALANPDPQMSVERFNTLSVDSTRNAIERALFLDAKLRTGEIKMTQPSLDAAGMRIKVETAKHLLEFVQHKAGCEFEPDYRDQRQYGKLPGEQEVVDRIRQMHADGLPYRKIARTLNSEGVFSRDTAWSGQTVKAVILNAERGKKLHPCACRMHRTDWVKPRFAEACLRCLQLKDADFENMLAKEGIHYDTTVKQVNNFPRVPDTPRLIPLPPAKEDELKPPLAFLNTVVHGDNIETIRLLPGNSVSLVFCSPPYPGQDRGYQGITGAEFPRRIVELLNAFLAKLKEGASVFFVVKEGIKNGRLTNYIRKTLDACEEAGWFQPGDYYWVKKDPWPDGSNDLPRRALEQILWFSKGKPYSNLRACGRKSDQIGMAMRHRWSRSHQWRSGIARVTNVVVVPVGSVDRGLRHSSVFPAGLPRRFIRTHAQPGLIVDPFAGSGMTCLVAQSEGYNFVGMDNGVYENGETYAEDANRNLKTMGKYAWGAAIRERERVERLKNAKYQGPAMVDRLKSKYRGQASER
jgi:DNA modification methylase